ncbi:hypothetical protein [Altericroceibacterium spongiae]|uniref:hypothetical protein n=1 Tax=Altericroceibacterium spongiae TaxID=2320269 RepID=UPI001EE50008|nr:hypothetical protein [Altericroceibacterium spongiae]
MTERRAAFLFLGETLLIPHLFPIVEALAAADPNLPVDLWVSTSMHEELLGGWIADLPNVCIRRAPGFRKVAAIQGRNPKLPAKLPMLARLAPVLSRSRVAICAEQTSLWLPTLLPMPTRFVKTSHGVGSMSARDDRRRRSAARTLVPSERERATYLERGMPPDDIVATGYVKAGFVHRTESRPNFAQTRPVILYNPHWQHHRSSWWDWGEQAVQAIVASGQWNLIFAPHQRLIEKVPELRTLCAKLNERDDVHCDYDSFAAVDGSYTAVADIYLGDTSSQLLEFLIRPRPAVFLDPREIAWESDPSYAMWACGDVVTDLDALLPALAAAAASHTRYASKQATLASDALGDVSGAAAERAAHEILTVLHG